MIICGVWVALVTAGSTFGTALMLSGQEETEAAHVETGIEVVRTRAINVPVIRGGMITGYVVGRFVFTVDQEVQAGLGLPPEAFVVDEMFRSVYTDPSIDFGALEPADIDALTEGVTRRVNEKMEGEVVTSILVDRFDYITIEDLRQQAMAGVPGGGS